MPQNKNLHTNILCASFAVLISALILHPYFQINVFHSTNLDQQFHMPPLLHASRLAWLGEGSFLFNYLTGEPMWGAPHFSPYYPLYGPLAIVFYDGLGIQDYMVIGDYIALIHRFILTIGCYYLARTLSLNFTTAVSFAVFVATAEAVRIPSNWYIAVCAYAWVPFMIGGTVDIFNERFTRGLIVLIISTLLSVYAAPLYLGLGISLIPCTTLLSTFIIWYLFKDGFKYNRIFKTKKWKNLGLLVLSAIGLLLMLTPIILSAYFGIEDYVRWLRTGPVTGKDISQVGTELFFETQGWSYAKRLVGEYGTRGIYSSFYLGAIFGFFFLSSPIIWTLWRSDYSEVQYILRVLIWLIAILHFGFIFGEKLKFPTLLQYVPLVNSFRHLSAFGSIFIILASLCAFDAATLGIKKCLEYSLKSNLKKPFFISSNPPFLLTILIIWFYVFYFSTEKISFSIASFSIIFTLTLINLSFFTIKKIYILNVLIVIFVSIGIYEQQNTKYNTPVTVTRYADSVSQINELLEGLSVKGELLNSEISAEFAKKEKIGGLFIQSHATTKNFRVVKSYLSPTHFEKFKAGRRTSTGSLKDMKLAGVTLLLIDNSYLDANSKYSGLAKEAIYLKSTEDFSLYRLQDSAFKRENSTCINNNVCGDIIGNSLYLNIFPFNEFSFRDKENVNSFVKFTATKKSSLLTRALYNKDMNLQISYKPRNGLLILILTIIGVALSLLTVRTIQKIN